MAEARRSVSTILRYERKLNDAKMKMIATDCIIRKVRAGEMDIDLLRRELRLAREVHIKGIKNVIWQLEVLTETHPPQLIKKAIKVNPNLPEEEKKIILYNKMKERETLNKECKLLMDIMFGRKIQFEHKKLLRKEYNKIQLMY